MLINTNYKEKKDEKQKKHFYQLIVGLQFLKNYFPFFEYKFQNKKMVYK